MRKHDLPNCPQWLLDADTVDEDVELDRFGRLIWKGGEFWGGEFLGGEFLGGEFWGGEFLGGAFRGGAFLGGAFLGGEFLGGEFLGESLTRPPVSLYGLHWRVQVTPTMMHIGGRSYWHEEWAAFSDDEIKAMATDALEFWHTHRDALLALCALEAAK